MITHRKLKIEAEGDRWHGLKPKIRLMGHWLERAGFKPGDHVQIHCVAPGVIALRSAEITPINESNPQPETHPCKKIV